MSDRSAFEVVRAFIEGVERHRATNVPHRDAALAALAAAEARMKMAEQICEAHLGGAFQSVAAERAAREKWEHIAGVQDQKAHEFLDQRDSWKTRAEKAEAALVELERKDREQYERVRKWGEAQKKRAEKAEAKRDALGRLLGDIPSTTPPRLTIGSTAPECACCHMQLVGEDAHMDWCVGERREKCDACPVHTAPPPPRPECGRCFGSGVYGMPPTVCDHSAATTPPPREPEGRENWPVEVNVPVVGRSQDGTIPWAGAATPGRAREPCTYHHPERPHPQCPLCNGTLPLRAAGRKEEDGG